MAYQLNEKEAYAAMIAFLEKYHELTKSQDIGGLLGSMQFLTDGKPADPALWSDWLMAIDSARDQA